MGFVVRCCFVRIPVGGAPFLGVGCVGVLSEEGVDFVLAVCFVDDDFSVPKFGWYCRWFGGVKFRFVPVFPLFAISCESASD